MEYEIGQNVTLEYADNIIKTGFIKDIDNNTIYVQLADGSIEIIGG